MTSTKTITPSDLVGKFFVSSWGYDQTNIDFYKVVGATAKRVKLQQWSAQRDEDQRLTPGEGPRTLHGQTAKVQLKKVDSGYQGDPWINLTSYSGASLWNGKPKSDTYTYGGLGH